MYSTEELDKLEQEEYNLTEETLVILLLLLSALKEDLGTELRSFYQKYGSDGVITQQEARKWISNNDHRRRLTVLLLYISDKFNMTLSELNPKLKSLLTNVIGKESDFFNMKVDNDKMLNKSWGVDESTWSDRLTNDMELWCAYVLMDLKRSISKRNNIDDTLTQLNKRFETIENALRRLVQTESTAMGSLTRQTIFKELGVEKYRFYSRADERTCDICGSLHGLVFPMSAYEVGTNASPIHPRCRCWEEPILE